MGTLLDLALLVGGRTLEVLAAAVEDGGHEVARELLPAGEAARPPPDAARLRAFGPGAGVVAVTAEVGRKNI